MWYYRRSWRALPIWKIPENYQPCTTVSVLVPARDEADTIQNCLNCLLKQDYPAHLYEIIVIDDHSTDQTAALVQQMQSEKIHLIHLADYIENSENIQAFKKKATKKNKIA